VFNTFDRNQSGTLELTELEAVGRDLGTELTAEEVEIAFNDIDTDKDGHISWEEFSTWWLKGRKGRSKLMRKLLHA
jgi:Ca2+-binding EF-hand superfamily protein